MVVAVNSYTSLLPKPGSEKDIASNMNINISYVGLHGEAIDINNLKSGTSFKAIIKVEHKGNLNSDHVAVNFRLPGGWEIENSRLATGEENPFPNTEFTDFRDDRLAIFLSMRKGDVRTFEVGLKATYAGRYYMPALQADDMYQPNIPMIYVELEN